MKYINKPKVLVPILDGYQFKRYLENAVHNSLKEPTVLNMAFCTLTEMMFNASYFYRFYKVR